VATRTPVADVAACDLTTLLTLAEEIRTERELETWTTREELMAMLIDLLHVMRVEALAGMGVKSPPRPLRVPRPGDRSEDDIPTVSPRQLAALTMGT
jgi:hypothetical protein